MEILQCRKLSTYPIHEFDVPDEVAKTKLYFVSVSSKKSYLFLENV